MIMKILVYSFLLFISSTLFAQEFSQINQTPLLYHPSFAGSTGSGRLSYAGNLSSYKKTGGMLEPSRAISNYLAYDNLWKKKGLGWGFSFLGKRSNSAATYLGEPAEYYSYYGNFRWRYFNLGANAYLSSKHVIRSSSDGRPKYTLSPSLSIGYAYGRSKISSTSTPYGVESTSFGIYHSAHLTAGLLFNTQYGYLGMSYKNTWSTFSYFHSQYYEYSSPASIQPTFSFVAARTFFSKVTDGKFSLTPSAYFEINGYYKKPNEWSTNTKSGVFNLTTNFWKFYVGAAYMSLAQSNRNVFAGFQNDNIRTGIGYGWNTDTPTLNFYELSFSYFFKSSEH